MILRRVVVGVLLMGSMVFLSTAAFAHEKQTQQDIEDIKLLRDAAAVLQQSRPDLAKGLSNYADREAGESDEMTEEQDEKEEMGEMAEPKEERGEHTKY